LHFSGASQGTQLVITVENHWYHTENAMEVFNNKKKHLVC